MQELINNILNYLENFVSRHSFFITGSYYGGLFSKYFSVAGFIIGFVLVLMVYFSSTEKEEKTGFLKVLAVIAVINSCTIIASLINSSFNQGFQYYGIDSTINAPDNIISGFILTLVVYSCYETFSGCAFLFGLATHAALPMLNFSYFVYLNTVRSLIQMITRLVLIGFLCIIINRRKYFFTGWIWYFGFHMLIRTVIFIIPKFVSLLGDPMPYEMDYSLSGIIEYFSKFTSDFIIFAVILFFAIVFEKAVLRTKPMRC